MNRIRLATSEEVETIKATSDLDNTCRVFALDTQHGTPFAVIRIPTEVDPIIYPKDFPDKMKLLFQRDIETVLAAQGIARYYFNIHANDEHWLKVVQTFGAVPQSTEPEIRFYKVL